MSSAAAISMSLCMSGGAPQVSSASTSTCAARTGSSSFFKPVRRLTTPPGTSDVASTSASVTAGSGRDSDAITTTVLPVTVAGARRLTSPSRELVSGAIRPITPVGSGIVKLKYGAPTGLLEPSTCPILSAQPAYHTQRSIARSTSSRDRPARTPSAAATSTTNWSRRPSISSATRYRIWPRFTAVRAAHGSNAFRAARTASRRSFLEARTALARGVPSAAETTYDRPDSERGNSPPTYSL